MVWYVAITVYILGAVIAVWGVTLLRRVWRRHQRQGVRQADAATGARQPRTVLAALVGMVCVPLGGAVVMVGDSARRGFEGWDGIPPQAWGIGATVVCLTFGAALVYAGVRFDPAAGRRRCPRCWYDMGGTTGMRCTECGREAKSERRLSRTRRCKRLVAVGLLLGMTPYAVRTAEVAAKDGWRAAVPTTALIVAFPYLSDEMALKSDWSLGARFKNGHTWVWQKPLFRWRRAWTLSRTVDIGVVWRCYWLRFGFPEVELSPAGTDAIFRAALAGTQPDTSYAIMLLIALDVKPPPAIATEHLQTAIEAMESRMHSRAAGGAVVVRYCGPEGERAVPTLLSLALDRGADHESRRMAMATLYLKVNKWPAAWDAYVTMLRDIEEPHRYNLFSYVGSFDSARVSQLETIFRKEMWGPDPITAGAAANSLIQISRDRKALVGEIEEFCRHRPDVDPGLICIFAGYPDCRNEQLARILDRMLGSDRPAAQSAAALACGNFGAIGRRFLPVLRTFEQYEGMRDERSQRARVAIERIIAASEMQDEY